MNPPLGATPQGARTAFRLWTPRAERAAVRLFAPGGEATETVAMATIGGGVFEATVGVGVGALYKFVLDDDEVPDPYARFLPYGVHGPAEVIARARTAALAPPVPLAGASIYEFHVGTFTPEGTFAAAAARLESLAALGITTVELMPVAAFAGRHGWGYDGVAQYAPHAPYGRPEDLRALVQRAHALGLAVLLDVVYNHFGPSGNYLGRYANEYFTSATPTPWGDALDYTQPAMRELVLGSARMWLEEYGFDGLRLDATHAIVDPSPRHILSELRELASSLEPPRLLVAEDDRNRPALVTDLGMDAIWADDFHHNLRTLLTGERDGYYAAYEPTTAALAHVIERGWSYEGQPYAPWGKGRGEAADALRPEQFVYCIDNHDQAGNRAFGERLSQDVGADLYAAATALLLFLPMTPLLFMGQEWAARTPLFYFTDHDPELGALVTKGRREEFKSFAAFADFERREDIPDPQAPETFERSKLRWEERSASDHARVLAVVEQLLALRRNDPVLRAPCSRRGLSARGDGALLRVGRVGPGGRRVLIANFGAVALTLDEPALGDVLFTTRPLPSGGTFPAACAAIVVARA